MSTLYGIPYMGSKTKIAVDILRQLPKGNRFVDLFGGGFAMTHAAMLTKRYKSFLYNDYNPLIVKLVEDAYNGKYNYSRFKPEFITRKQYEVRCKNDGYISHIWSFGSNPEKGYMFGEDIESLKHAAHDFVVFGKWDNKLNRIAPQLKKAVTSKNIGKRREQFCAWCRSNKKRFDLQNLEAIERLQQLEQLERSQQLERLQQLERFIIFNCGSYTDYEYQDGDIVYCDPPYESATGYSGGFDHKAFYDWVASRPYQVWFSSYKITDKRFRMIWAKRVTTCLGTNNNAHRYECLYTNR